MKCSYETQKYISAYNQLLKECNAIYHAAAMNAGVSDCAYWILYTVQDSSRSYTQSEICGAGFMPRQTVNSALKKLERDGYLTLKRREGKLGKCICLTETGKSFVQKHIIPVMLAEEKACNQFTDQEKEQFLTLFRSLIEHLKNEINKTISEEN